MYAVDSPCCHRRVLVEGWEIEYAKWWNDGRVYLRCGSILDAPGWRRTRDHREGCGEPFIVHVTDIKIRHS